MRALDVILRKAHNGEIYNIGTGELASADEITDRVLAGLGLDAKDWREYGPDRLQNDAQCLLDSSKIRGLGWKPEITLRSWKGLDATIAWYCSHPEWWMPLQRELLEKRGSASKQMLARGSC